MKVQEIQQIAESLNINIKNDAKKKTKDELINEILSI
jgi:hypothetical protein